MSRSYVEVRFRKEDKKTYIYVVDGEPEALAHFTHAVVDSPYNALTVVEVVRFSTLDESSYNGTYKDIITLFDLSYYDEKLAKKTRKAALEKELRARVAKKKLEDNFAALLVDDEEGQKLLAEFKTL